MFQNKTQKVNLHKQIRKEKIFLTNLVFANSILNMVDKCEVDPLGTIRKITKPEKRMEFHLK